MKKLGLSLSLAFKSIVRGNRWAALMIVLLMALSFANLILTPSIMSGVTRSLDSQQVNTIFGNIVITPVPRSPYIENSGQTVALLGQYPGVSGVATHLADSAAFSSQPGESQNPPGQINSGNWTVTGIDPAAESSVTTISKSLIAGSYLTASDTNAVVLGVEIAGGPQAQNAALLTLGGVNMGDTVGLTFSNGVRQDFSVKGIFQAHDGQADSQAFITRSAMASILGSSFENRVTCWSRSATKARKPALSLPSMPWGSMAWRATGATTEEG